MATKTLFTIGHSTHTTREFIRMLKANDIRLIVDVRYYPGSRHCPQFGKARLKRNLLRNKIDYIHLLSLGGRRRPDRESHENDGWRSPQFRGYADYMQTEAFHEALAELFQFAKNNHTAIMCSEAVPWRCHRSLIADAAIANGWNVRDIFTEKKTTEHAPAKFAKFDHGEVTYPLA